MKTIVTTIQRGAKVNKVLLKNMLAFADEHGIIKIQAFVMDGRNKDDIEIDPIVYDYGIELIVPTKTGTPLNSNLKLYDTMIRASQINPLTGFNKKLSRDHSYILPSPKIRYLSIPNTSKLPRFLCTTGSLTDGNYKLHTAQGRKANLEHQYGFVFVEIENNKRFDIHQVEAMRNGKFNYLTEYYSNGKKLKQQPEALVLGDWHTGDTCPKTRARTIQMIHDLKPKRVVFHDLFNGHSINHHEEKNFISKARLINDKRHELEKELKQVLDEVNFFAKEFPRIQFLVAESNHDIFLTTYLGTHNWLKDGQNSIVASKLFAPIVENRKKASLEVALSLIGKLPTNFNFLVEDQEYRVSGIALDYHGHRGLNGARGSSSSFDKFNLRMITGHEHTPKLYANGMVVGTSTHLKLNYTKGAGSWLNAHGILYKSGKYALLTLV
jgi:hypothetical protein